DLDAVGRAPSRFDFAKLDNLNAHYLRAKSDAELTRLVVPRIEQTLGQALDQTARSRLEAAMPGLKSRAKTLVELAEIAHFYVAPRPIPIDVKGKALLDPVRPMLKLLSEALAGLPWDPAALEGGVRDFAAAQGLKLGAVAQPLRAALTGTTASP